MLVCRLHSYSHFHFRIFVRIFCGCRSPQYFACLPIDAIFHGFLASFISKSVFFASPKSSFWTNFSYAPPAIPLLLRSCSHLMKNGISYFQLFLASVTFVDLKLFKCMSSTVVYQIAWVNKSVFQTSKEIPNV